MTLLTFVVRNHNSFVKKKAALCLLRLFRKFPDVFRAIDWAPRILSMMDDHDLVGKKKSVVHHICEYRPTQNAYPLDLGSCFVSVNIGSCISSAISGSV
jgi:hypothetical protein